jgi:hypothetical protein
MTRYKSLTIRNGTKFIKKIQNLFFKELKDEEFFVEPWDNKELADCVEFRLNQTKGLPNEILFFVSDEEIIRFLSNTHGQLYLFGAYNQVSVCQMRAKGTVTLEDKRSDVRIIREHLRTKISMRIVADPRIFSEKEVQDRFKILDQGVLFCFHPEEYAYDMYERG